MLQSFADAVALYDYAIPKDRIALAPASPRDSAKLVVLHRRTGKKIWTTVRRLPGLLPQNAVLVLNETKVLPARMHVRRATGARISVLVLGRTPAHIRVLSPRALRTGETLTLDGKFQFIVHGSLQKEWLLRPLFPMRQFPVVLERHGVMPLPPYIKNSPLTERMIRTRYQTVFAKNAGSIAAPTASLHFTKRLLNDIERAGVTIARVTLHVHLGTFASLTEEQWKSGKLHEEFYGMDAKTARLLSRAKKEGRPIIAAGTTVARTLESASDAEGTIVRPRGGTCLFIREGYRFRMVDGLLTNFHVPRSSLLMLVSALAGREEVLDLYVEAVKHRFRFYSFGDAMLIL